MTQDVISNIYKETSLCVMYLLFTFGLCNLRYQYKSIHISSCKFFVYFARKNLFFLFYTSTFTKHLHQFIYSTHLFNKIFILFTFFLLFPSLSSLAQTHHLVFPVHTHTQPATLQQNPAIDSLIFHNNKIRPLILRSSTTTITTTTTQSQSQQL